MAVEKTLSNPTIEISDMAIWIVPNSLTYSTGTGECKFQLFYTQKNIEAVSVWHKSINGETIDISEGSFSVSFREMFIMTDPKITLGEEGNRLEVIFKIKTGV